MLSKLIIVSSLDDQKAAGLEELKRLDLSLNHPDLLWIEPIDIKKIGVEDIKTLKNHLSYKPHSARGKAAIIVSADNLTQDAQNALLKTLEEPPQTASLILTAASESNLLTTILSRCQIIYLDNKVSPDLTKLDEVIKKLMDSNNEERFQIIEQTEDKQELLDGLIFYIQKQLGTHPEKVEFAKLLIKAKEWADSNVNIRTILEYLMLELS